MNRNELPRTSIAIRFQALFAAAVVTVAMLTGINSLAGDEGAGALVVQSTLATQRA
ncbi:MAG: hypothetical protein OEW27_02235 [Aquincola sp.]|nr:hypothetical protein [Aquincola sp.]MDH5328746.1 hypothetical protein [Aquincola sp.]